MIIISDLFFLCFFKMIHYPFFRSVSNSEKILVHELNWISVTPAASAFM